MQLTPSGQVYTALDGTVLFANPAFYRLSGGSSAARFQDHLGRGARIFFETQVLPALLVRGSLTEIALELESGGGHKAPVVLNAQLSHNAQGAPQGVLMAVLDATNRREYERELQQARKEADQVAEIVRRSSDAIIAVSSVGLIEAWNTGAERLFGYTASEISGRPFTDIFSEEQRPLVTGNLSDLNQGLQFTRDLTALKKGGDAIEISMSLTPHLEAPGVLVASSAIVRDITARRAAEKDLLENMAALAASEQRLRTAAQTANLGSWDLDLVSGLMACSDQCKANYGRSPEQDFNYNDLRAAIHPDDLDMVAERVDEALKRRNTYKAEYRNIWPDGSLHWVIASGRAEYTNEGVPYRMTGFTLDVTERHRAQAALLESEKLAAVGRLASLIAHEINNPLESVTNLLYLAANSDDLPVTKSYLEMADQELRRIAGITSQTLRFHRQSGRAKAVAPKDLVDSVTTIFKRRLENGAIQVSTRYRAQGTVECLDGEVRQVLTNLVSNAIDAMQPGGCLAMRTRDGEHKGQHGIWFTVSDDGCGMPLAVQQKLFEAFYTTKGINGTGLGMWVSKQIIDRHHGALVLRSSQSPKLHGTVFSLFLPSTSQMESSDSGDAQETVIARLAEASALIA